MEPKYSILLCNQEITEYQERINTWLKTGIKVLWFGKKTDVTMLKDRFRSFSDAFLLQAYAFDYDNDGIVIDGQDRDGLVDILEEVCPMFNAAQYKVEHCQADKHIIVQASAGTGKTTVMIDRIMYLLHTQPDLHLAEVFMITFTNDAAEQMNQRLQDALMTRYKLTGNQRYLRWVEEQSQMNVSTIHSFAYFMLKEYGIGESFTKNLAIRSFQYERRELIKDVIDGMIDENHKVLDQLGVPFYRANSMVGDFWNGFAKLGISHRDVGRMDWGKPIDVGSEPFQKVMTGILTKLDEDYFDIKRKNEAISVDDIMRDLQEVLQSDVLPKPDITMKYLFIDEFQDSDLSQIMVACLMIKLLNPALFVVGDVKQSIYRFRGATDQAFFVLKRDMQEMQIDSPKEYTLVNNYRTSASVLKRMDQYFKVWGQMDQLQYDKPVIPFNQDPGSMRMVHGKKSSQMDTQAEDQIARIASDSLNELVARVEESGKPANEKTRVVMLTRSNNELRQLSRILRKNRIPAEIRRDGSFYASDAVRDFYVMVSSFLFSDEPKYIFNYLLTPYAGEIDPININDMEHLHGDYENLVSYLDRFLDQTNWKKYHKELRLRPVLAVLKEIQDDDALIDHYIQNSKARRRAQGWEENRCNAATFSDALQYQANLDERPACHYVVPANMSHVGIERLGTCRTEEYAAEYHYSGFVAGAEKDPDGIYRADRPQYPGIADGMYHSGDSEEEEPHQHDRPEEPAYVARTALLYEEEPAHDGQSYHYHDELALSEYPVHQWYASKALHRSRNCHGRSKDSVGEHGAASYHRRDYQPPAAVPDQAVQGEYAALSVVVRPQSDEHMLYRCQQSNGP